MQYQIRRFGHMYHGFPFLFFGVKFLKQVFPRQDLIGTEDDTRFSVKDRGVENIGFNDVLKEVAAKGQFRHYARFRVRHFAQGRHIAQFAEMNGNSQRRRGCPPPARSH